MENSIERTIVIMKDHKFYKEKLPSFLKMFSAYFLTSTKK